MTQRGQRAVFAITMSFMVMSVSGFNYAATYSTLFPLTENPVSEGGRWINGGDVGLDWDNIATMSGAAVGTLSTVGYSDPTALLTGTWRPDQTVEATVYSRNQTDQYAQEVELRLRSSMAPHSITGYEVFFRCLKTESAYAQIVRWNGALGDFTTLALNGGAQYGVADGDVVKATSVGNVITGYVNGVEVISATDNTFTGGNPGMGFNYGVGNTYTDFGFSDLSATDSLVTSGAETTCRFVNHPTLTWDPVVGAMQYNVYRGFVSGLTDSNSDHRPDGGYGTCQDSRDPNLTDTIFVDTDVPTEAQIGFFYLVAYPSGGVEIGLGSSSLGIQRTMTVPCP